jgi:phosphate transport system substrate-binding protein
VQGAAGTIGYADASKAGTLGTAKIKVGDAWVAHSAASAAAVVDASPRVTGRHPHDIAVAIDRTTTAPGAYPLVLVSYEIACLHYTDAATAALVKAFLTYESSAEGQDAAASAAGSAPISDTLRVDVQAAITAIG